MFIIMSDFILKIHGDLFLPLCWKTADTVDSLPYIASLMFAIMPNDILSPCSYLLTLCQCLSKNFWPCYHVWSQLNPWCSIFVIVNLWPSSRAYPISFFFMFVIMCGDVFNQWHFLASGSMLSEGIPSQCYLRRLHNSLSSTLQKIIKVRDP